MVVVVRKLASRGTCGRSPKLWRRVIVHVMYFNSLAIIIVSPSAPPVSHFLMAHRNMGIAT